MKHQRIGFATLTAIMILLITPAFAQQANSAYVFAPDDSDFSVTFPRAPEIETVGFPEVQIVRASLTIPSADGFLRAELYRYETGTAQYITDEFIVTQLHAYAVDNGLTSPEVRVIHGPVGRCGHLKAVKRLQQVSAMYENTACYGASSMIMLYIGARADVFPPPGATAFLNSLELLTE